MTKLLAIAALDNAILDIGVREKPLGSNLGGRVEQYQKTAGVAPPEPYCACAIYTWYNEAAANLGIKNPLRRTGYCPDLLNWGKVQGLVIDHGDAKPGDIILFYHASMGRVAHTEIVRHNFGGGKLVTVGANTNASGARNGDGVYEKERTPGARDVVLNMQGFGVAVVAPAPIPAAPAAPETGHLAFTQNGVKIFDNATGKELFEDVGRKVSLEWQAGRFVLRVG